MEQALIRRLKPGTLDAYREVAKAHGRSLEAELREVIERNRPEPAKDAAYLLALSDRALAASGPALQRDSAPYIRWMRDTNAGRIEDADRFDDAGN